MVLLKAYGFVARKYVLFETRYNEHRPVALGATLHVHEPMLLLAVHLFCLEHVQLHDHCEILPWYNLESTLI